MLQKSMFRCCLSGSYPPKQWLDSRPTKSCAWFVSKKKKIVCLVGVACLCLLDSQVCRQTYHNCVDSELLMPCKTERLDETMTLRTNVTYTVWLLGQGTLPTNLSDQDLFNSLWTILLYYRKNSSSEQHHNRKILWNIYLK